MNTLMYILKFLVAYLILREIMVIAFFGRPLFSLKVLAKELYGPPRATVRITMWLNSLDDKMLSVRINGSFGTFITNTLHSSLFPYYIHNYGTVLIFTRLYWDIRSYRKTLLQLKENGSPTQSITLNI